MASVEGQKILQWLYKNVKNGNCPKAIEEARAGVEALASRNHVGDDITVEFVSADGVNCECLTALCSKADKYILFLHGGGYCMGSSRASRKLISEIIFTSKCKVLSVDYRLAPENPFPAALDDAFIAYCWLLRQGILPENIIVAGESAGGGLAVSLMVRLRDKKINLSAGAVLVSPWTDLARDDHCFHVSAEADPFYNSGSINWKTAQLYAGQEGLYNPLISPVYADLEKLPEVLIHVGTNDVLIDDSTRIAEKLKNVGVSVNLKIWDDMWHIWHAFGDLVPEAKEAIDQIGTFIKEKLEIS